MFDTPDDLEEEILGLDPTSSYADLEDASHTVASLAMKTALTRSARAVLKKHPSIFIVTVPQRDWVPTIAAYLKEMEGAPIIRSAPDRIRQGGVMHKVGADDLNYLRHGRSVLYVSQDPEGILDDTVLAAADIVISVPKLTPTHLRKAIRSVTGQIARGVTAAMADLPLPVILSIVRAGRSARDVVLSLKQALSRRHRPVGSVVPLLPELPLTPAMRTWSDQMLSDLNAVRSGELDASQLVCGVLEGPSGTGKTLVAESLARTAGWTFVFTSLGAWFSSGDGALGGVAKNLKTFIDDIVSNEPAIGFLDELDALPNRATMDNRGRDWWTPVVTYFLTEIDRLRKSGKQVLLLGATNYYDRLDSALVRPGRLQQRVSVLPPQTEEEIAALLRFHLRGEMATADVSIIARLGRGAPPATVEGWVKAARSHARAHQRPMEMSDLMAEVLPRDDRSSQDLHAIAIHEIGHAIVAHRLGLSVESISLVPDTRSEGHTWMKLNTRVPTWQDVLDLVAASLGGRAADIVLGKGPNAGAEGDLAYSTSLLVAAHERQGLGGNLAFAPAFPGSHAEQFAAIDTELQKQLKRAIAIVEENRQIVGELARKLLAQKVLSENALVEACNGEHPACEYVARDCLEDNVSAGSGPAGCGIP